MMSVQTKPQVEQSTPTCNQSIVLVRNLIRIAISTIAYERKLFPEDFFRDRVLAGVNIKSLSPGDDNSSLLVSWLEEGVFEALEKKYLEKIILNLFNEPQCEKAFERYEFFVEYSAKDGEVSSISVAKNGFHPHSRSEIKEASVNLVTQLIDMAEKLPPVPARCFCSFNLVYRTTTPTDYEPKGFSHMTPREEDLLPFSHKAGQVVTEHHRMGLSLKLPVDLFEDIGILRTQSQTQSSNIQEIDSVVETQHVKQQLRDLNYDFLKLVCDGRSVVKAGEVKAALNIGDKMCRELHKAMAKKGVVGPYTSNLKGRPVLVCEDSIQYLEQFGLSFQGNNQSPPISPSRKRQITRKPISPKKKQKVAEDVPVLTKKTRTPTTRRVRAKK